jgi:hypothetical protein
MKWNDPRNNAQQDIVNYLRRNPNKTEKEIQLECFGFDRVNSLLSNKKYAQLLRRALNNGKIKRKKIIIHKRGGRQYTFRYSIVKKRLS